MSPSGVKAISRMTAVNRDVSTNSRAEWVGLACVFIFNYLLLLFRVSRIQRISLCLPTAPRFLCPILPGISGTGQAKAAKGPAASL